MAFKFYSRLKFELHAQYTSLAFKSFWKPLKIRNFSNLLQTQFVGRLWTSIQNRNVLNLYSKHTSINSPWTFFIQKIASKKEKCPKRNPDRTNYIVIIGNCNENTKL